MLTAVLCLCIGFMIAVLYIDLVFDISAWPHRGNRGSLPSAVLDPIATYYRYITKNPYVLMFVMLTAVVCIAAEIIYDRVPRWVGYLSLLLVALNTCVAVLKVIPTAQRLAAGEDTLERRSHMVHSLLPFHGILLASVLLLAAIQLSALIE